MEMPDYSDYDSSVDESIKYVDPRSIISYPRERSQSNIDYMV